MVKSVLGVYHRGLHEWMIQRVSAIIMALFSIFLISYLVTHPDLSFGEWHHLFSLQSVKVFTLLFIAAMLYHAWIGMWTIFTDYVKSFVVRSILNFFVILSLFACFFWGLLILWSV